MKHFKFLIFSVSVLTLAVSCAGRGDDISQIIDRGMQRAKIQSLAMAGSLAGDTTLLPRTFENGQLVPSDSRWWCSGFFPGVLWYLYQYDNDPDLKKFAADYTARVEREKFTTDNHDVGFMIFCSFGHGLRLTADSAYADVIVQASRSLSTRYDPTVGLIRSWDWNRDVWHYPVIIDNMMNLEMLLWAARHTGEDGFETIALNHADKTMKEHYREDFSSYHVVDYDPATGGARLKVTAQGYADHSSWARGQAWGLYGYTMMFRETGFDRYLSHAEQIARFILDHPRLPGDGIPYWDFDAPDIPDALRDASAGAIMASALVELASLTKDNILAAQCLQTAEKQIRTLSSPEYLAEPGENGNFILKHSVGTFPKGKEVDVPLTYADYYYVEAMMRYKKLLESKNQHP